MTWLDFWGTVLPPLAAALAMVITALAWTAVAYLKSVRDTFKEAKSREALHSAASTGLQEALERDPLAPDKQLVAMAARHILDKGSPDAVKDFDLSGSDIARFVSSKIGGERAKKLAEKRPG